MFNQNELDSLNARLKGLEKGNIAQKASVWQRLEDSLKRMSPEQIAFINTNPQGLEKKKQMNDLFFEWLFEKYKNEFVEVKQFEEIAQGYVDTIVSTAQEFSQNQANMKEENDKLKAELEELRKAQKEWDKSKEEML